MRTWSKGLLAAGCLLFSAAYAADSGDAGAVLKGTVKDIDGKDVDLKSFLGKVVLVTNVASQWGLTNKQYASLASLHKKYKDKGFEILAFPANNFGQQEPGTNAEIKAFCAKKDVDFKLFAKISVKGKDIHPLYKSLTSKKTVGKFAGDIRWNFDKFLLDRHGKVIARFKPPVDPMGPEVTKLVEKALKEPAPKAKKK